MKKLLHFFILLALLPAISSAQIYVKVGGTGDGSSWQNAAGNLRNTLFSASAGSEVWIAAGTYHPVECNPCSIQDRNESFWIPSGVQVYGGFSGNETSLNQRDWLTNRTILSGDIDQDNSLINNSYSVIFTLNVNAETVLDGLHIVMGNADGNSLSLEDRESSGGGWFNAAVDRGLAVPTVRNCAFSRNYAKAFGGAIYNLGSFFAENSPTYENCVFDRNKAVFDGGGMYNNGSFGGVCEPRITNSRFRDNIAGTTDLGSAGAIFNNGIEGQANPIIINTKFTRNSSSLEGGAIYNQGKEGNSSPELVNCVFWQNSSDLGGVMYNLGAEGRALPRVTNCTFYDNFARNGAAIFNNGANGGNANTYVTNSIFWKNEAETGKTFFNIIAKPQIHYSLVEEKDCTALNQSLDDLSQVICGSTVLFNINPKFVNPTSGDFQLNYNSPIINFGDNSAVGNNATDATENNRIHLGQIDLGAYEYNGPVPTRMDELSVVAEGGSIQLNWSTQNEYQNAEFLVQRSIDSLNFETIATIKSQGDATTPQIYTYEDQFPEAGFTNFYRLQRMDKDGCFEYSMIQSAFIEVGETSAILAPNPTVSTSILEINLERPTNVDVQVVTPYGQVISRPVNEMLERGRTLVPIEINDGLAGMFYVYVRLGSKRYGYPLLVIK
ncbi:MAG: choice-of-anchor Q domain-containing protein [Saprospiraceae bacterium]